jgi:UDP-N-acetylmuramoyl-L-alanyl-D-glutamate--2,6-diaminopimelate ligase
LQSVGGGQPFDVLIDYAHTVNAFQTVLSAVRARTAGRLIAVFGAAGDRDRAKRPEFARLAARHADMAIITNEDPFGEQPEAIIDEVMAGIPEGDVRTEFVREPDRGRAIARALSSAAPGDAVLILGKGHEQSIMVDGARVPWSDAEVAAGLLETLR